MEKFLFFLIVLIYPDKNPEGFTKAPIMPQLMAMLASMGPEWMLDALRKFLVGHRC